MFTSLYLKWKQLPQWLKATRERRILRYFLFIANCFLVPFLLINALWPVSELLAGILAIGTPFGFSLWFSVSSFRKQKAFDAGAQSAILRMFLANTVAANLSLLARYAGYGIEIDNELFLFTLMMILLITIAFMGSLFRGKARRFLFPIVALLLTSGSFLVFVLVITV